MSTRTVTVHDRCTKPGCKKVLLSIAEGERGICSHCWYETLDDRSKASIARLIAVTIQKDAESSPEQDRILSENVQEVLTNLRRGGRSVQ